MIRCTKCRRKLTRDPTWWQGSAFGPRCAIAVGAPRSPKPRRSRKVKADERTADLFAEVRA